MAGDLHRLRTDSVDLFHYVELLCDVREGQGPPVCGSVYKRSPYSAGGQTLSKGSHVIPAMPDRLRFRNEMRRIHTMLTEWIGKREMGENLELVLTDEGLTLRFDDSLLFGVGSAALSIKTLPLLDKIGQAIEQTDYPVRIEGHTDNIPIRTRRYPSNWELSTARAVNVLRYFVKSRNISAQQLTAVGCGPFQPLTTNDSWKNRSKNRRVEIIIHRGE